jgi:hypothetical protein
MLARRRGALRRLPPPLRSRNYALLWAALLGMGLATQMVEVDVGWQVYAIHRYAARPG